MSDPSATPPTFIRKSGRGAKPKSTWKTAAKWAAGVIVGLVILGAIFGEDPEEERPGASAPSTTPAPQQDAADRELTDAEVAAGEREQRRAERKAARSAPVARTPRPVTGKRALEQLIRDAEVSSPVSDVEVYGRKGSYTVEASFPMEDNLTEGLIQAGVENEMEALYEAIYGGEFGSDVDFVMLQAEAPLTDNLGNESTGTAYSTTMRGTIARQVNWANTEAVNFKSVYKVGVDLIK